MHLISLLLKTAKCSPKNISLDSQKQRKLGELKRPPPLKGGGLFLDRIYGFFAGSTSLNASDFSFSRKSSRNVLIPATVSTVFCNCFGSKGVRSCVKNRNSSL